MLSLLIYIIMHHLHILCKHQQLHQSILHNILLQNYNLKNQFNQYMMLLHLDIQYIIRYFRKSLSYNLKLLMQSYLNQQYMKQIHQGIIYKLFLNYQMEVEFLLHHKLNSLNYMLQKLKHMLHIYQQLNQDHIMLNKLVMLEHYNSWFQLYIKHIYLQIQHIHLHIKLLHQLINMLLLKVHHYMENMINYQH